MKRLVPAAMGIALGLAAFGIMEAFTNSMFMDNFTPGMCVVIASLVAFVCCFLFIRFGEEEREKQ